MFADPRPVEVHLMGQTIVRGMGRIVQFGHATHLEVAPFDEEDRSQKVEMFNLHSAVFKWRIMDDSEMPGRRAPGDRNLEALAATINAQKADLVDCAGALSWCLAKLYAPAIGTSEHASWQKAQDLLFRLPATNTDKPQPRPTVDSDEDIPF